MKTSDNIVKKFGKQVRVRVMGLFVKNDQLLLINHKGLNEEDEIWLPPGGGVEFGENAIQCLEREFLEETNLEIQVGELLFVNEFISETIHAVELFFEVKKAFGEIKLGRDPELGEKQILAGIEFMTIDQIKSKGRERVHRWLGRVDSLAELQAKRGFFHF